MRSYDAHFQRERQCQMCQWHLGLNSLIRFSLNILFDLNSTGPIIPKLFRKQIENSSFGYVSVAAALPWPLPKRNCLWGLLMFALDLNENREKEMNTRIMHTHTLPKCRSTSSVVHWALLYWNGTHACTVPQGNAHCASPPFFWEWGQS